MPTEHIAPPPSTAASTSAPALSIAGLKFRYPGAGRWTVDIPALTLARAEQVLLTGGSGSGKSTILHIIAGLTDPTEGELAIDGQPIHSARLPALRGAARDHFRGRRVGMIFQTLNLLHGFTAAENVMAALMFSTIPVAEHRPRALELLATLGIDRPNAQIDRLSIGQQQRVAVARAVACHPVLVLADEPTASLDPENAAAAMELIQSTCAAQGAALLCVSHDPAMRARFARVENLDQGYLKPRPATV